MQYDKDAETFSSLKRDAHKRRELREEDDDTGVGILIVSVALALIIGNAVLMWVY